MKILLIGFFCFAASVSSFCQLPAMDSSAFTNWPLLKDITLSNDGNYVYYGIDSTGKGVEEKQCLVVRSTRNSWQTTITGGNSPVFSSDCHYLYYKTKGNTLETLDLSSSQVSREGHISKFSLIDNWLVLETDTTHNSFIVRNLLSRQTSVIDKVESFKVVEKGKLIVYQTRTTPKGEVALWWWHLPTGKPVKIWEGPKILVSNFDAPAAQMAFLVQQDKQKEIWYYSATAGKAVCLLKENEIGDTALQIASLNNFSADGKRFFFKLQPKAVEQKTHSPQVKVDVWSYQDAKLKSQQLAEAGIKKTYLAGYSLDSHQYKRLEYDNDVYLFDNPLYAFVMHGYANADLGEYFWNPATKRRPLLIYWNQAKCDTVPLTGGMPSAMGKYLLFYSSEDKAIKSYEVKTGMTRNLTRGIATNWTTYGNDRPDSATSVGFLAVKWFADDSLFMVADRYDLWILDPLGIKPAVNLTAGYGAKKGIVFSYPLNLPAKGTLADGQQLLLAAFNRQTKENGYFLTTIGKKGKPDSLTMGPYLYHVYHEPILNTGRPPMKAGDAEAYIVQRMSAEEFPNYFFTTDLKTFSPLTSLHPEISCNWLTTELVNYRSLDGRLQQGILYKPANFDSSKKYPTLFYLYEQLSNNLHVFLNPHAFEGQINIPFMVSQGYLVFTPDVHYTLGYPGRSAYNAVMGAVQHLGSRRYFDKTRLGIQGHSFGGFEVNYIVAHTGLFKAACSASGVSDFISNYNSIVGRGSSKQGNYEAGQCRIGYTLWQRPDLYIENSAVLRADKIRTPLLLMNNKEDDAVAFSQGVELFLALRRLQKKGWMLQYDGEQHTIIDERNQRDYTIRVMQFFDHYLKGAAIPAWMAKGIPATLKGIDNGLQLAR